MELRLTVDPGFFHHLCQVFPEETDANNISASI